MISYHYFIVTMALFSIVSPHILVENREIYILTRIQRLCRGDPVEISLKCLVYWEN